MENDIYIFNPEYRLRKDNNRIHIFHRRKDPTIEDFMGLVHPLYAILLSLFDGNRKVEDVIHASASLMGFDEALIANIVRPLLENSDPLLFSLDGYQLRLPARVLTRKSGTIRPETLNPRDFFIPRAELDMKTWRMSNPLDILLMINGRCSVDCMYCYADRRQNLDCGISIGRFREIFEEAKALGMRAIDITGGELFLYPHWEKLLQALSANGFSPFISTKMPLNPDTILKLKDLGINRLQVSIDSVVKEELMQILGVGEDYRDRLLKTLKNLDDNDFEIYTNSQVTSINQNSIGQLIDQLLGLKNIKRLGIGAAGFSLYKGEEKYVEYRPHLERVKKIETTVDELKGKYEGRVQVNFSGYLEKDSILNSDRESRKRNFMARARCTGNFYAFTILPDGQVTVCEELYRHPRFLIGDITRQSIREVWNSEKALGLYNLSRDLIGEASCCKSCDEFDDCHKFRGVCWKEVLYAYGDENWDYPDPKCPYAPPPLREYYL